MDHAPTSQTQPRMPLRKPSHARSIVLFSLCALCFWFTEFAISFWYYDPGDIANAFTSSFAYAGGTLIGLALFSSAIFKWFPRTAQYWRLRRYLGVGGFIFIAFHVAAAMQSIFDWSLADAYYSFNPIENPVIFGSIAFYILFLMAATSTDWAMQKLTPKRWKLLHRYVYLAYWAAIMHFILENPDMYTDVRGLLLLAITSAALFGQLFWFITIASKKQFKTFATVVGICVIALYVIGGYFAYKHIQEKNLAARQNEAQ